MSSPLSSGKFGDDGIGVLLRRCATAEITGDGLAFRDRLGMQKRIRFGVRGKKGEGRTYGKSSALNLGGVIKQVHVSTEQRIKVGNAKTGKNEILRTSTSSWRKGGVQLG